MPACSIVIPWYRSVVELRRAVDSVLAQDEQDFEIIVVANGVTDEAYAEVAGLYRDPRIRTARITEAGASIARNRGLALASGDLIFLLDADDAFHPAKLARFRELHRTTGFDVAFSRGLRLRSNGVSWPWPVGHWDGRRPIAEFFFCDGCTISASALVLTQQAKGGVKFSESHKPYEDPDLVIQAEHLGLVVRMLAEPLYDWFDDRTDGRLSRHFNWDERMAWLDAAPANFSPRAKAAFRARCVAQHAFPRRFFACLTIFADALSKRAIPPADIALFMLRGFVPLALREQLINRYFIGRARKFAEKSNPADETQAAVNRP